jgi:putative ABC transport system ATP-binding protein
LKCRHQTNSFSSVSWTRSRHLLRAAPQDKQQTKGNLVDQQYAAEEEYE